MTLPKPQNVTATRTPSGILIDWDAVPDADVYIVERNQSVLGETTTTNYTDPTPAPDGATYMVTAGFPESESDPVTLAPLPKAKKWSRSVPGSTTVVNWALAHPDLFHEGDAIGLLTGGGPTGVASTTWVNQQALRLKAFRDRGVVIFAQVSGTKDVDTVAKGCKANIDAIALVRESGFGVESEPWDPSQAASESVIKKAKAMCDAQGVDLILHMSGKGVPWRSDDIPTWNYTAFANIVGPSHPNVIQTQRDYQSDWEANNGRVNKAIGLVKQQIPSWLPQVTLEASEVNGITHNKPGDPAKAFLDLLAEAEAIHGRGAGHSLWSLDTTSLGAVLAETFDWTV